MTSTPDALSIIGEDTYYNNENGFNVSVDRNDGVPDINYLGPLAITGTDLRVDSKEKTLLKPEKEIPVVDKERIFTIVEISRILATLKQKGINNMNENLPDVLGDFNIDLKNIQNIKDQLIALLTGNTEKAQD